jgi:hypothetical protein
VAGTSAQFSLVLRVRIAHRPGMLGRVATAIGDAGGTIGSVDLISIDDDTLLRDIIVDAADEQHGKRIAAAVDAVEGAEVVDDEEAVESEAVQSEFMAPDPATLVLRPLCSDDGLRRFAVDHVSGPLTRFTVGVEDVFDDRRLRIAAGATRRFWVDAAPQDTVVIAWPDGSATASPVERPCDLAGAVSGERPPAPAASAVPEVEASADTARSRRRRPSLRGDDTPAGLSAPAPAGGSGVRDPADTDPAAAGRRDGPEDVRPTASEVVIRPTSDARPVGANLTVAALVVTVVLLVASVGVGAASRRGS